MILHIEIDQPDVVAQRRGVDVLYLQLVLDLQSLSREDEGVLLVVPVEVNAREVVVDFGGGVRLPEVLVVLEKLQEFIVFEDPRILLLEDFADLAVAVGSGKRVEFAVASDD